jgi:hypothetical protein
MPQQWPGGEHAVLVDHGGPQWTARGVALAVLPTGAIRVDYELCAWPVGCLLTAALTSDRARRRVELTSDADHRWHDSGGTAQPQLDGCTDVDLAITPLTNTLPLRRLSAEPVRATELAVAYLSVPSLRVSCSTQTYMRLETLATGTTWRYASGRFRAELLVDSDGVVDRYSDLWQRVRPETR